MTENTDEIWLNVDLSKKSRFLGRSVEDGLPITAPLHDLEEVLAWQTDDPDDPGQVFSISNVPFYGKHIPEGSTKTLVCHDMAGGYVDDRFVQGTLCTDDKWYYFVNWDVVDIFVYFSHHFITVPPVGWINSAHRSGVAVLGTLITEFDQGYNRWKAIFSCEFLWKALADKLVQIAKYYKFEGWLLNIENEIKKERVPAVKEFVQYLTKQMHDTVQGSQVIWYDSVTKDGDLKWQDALNTENKEFFESCDGIFLNYGWNEEKLEESAKLAETMSRVQDVYVGIDVFGRGCFGGGGFNSVAALEVIRRYQLSAAIFAPGWVKEVLGSKDFEANQKRFWDLLTPYCNKHGMCSTNQIFLMTSFATGMKENQQQRVRSLHLSQQNTMPALSGSSAMTLRDSVLTLNNDSHAALFNTSFQVIGGFLILSVLSDGDLMYSGLSLVTDIGKCPLGSGGDMFSIHPMCITLPRHMSYTIWIIESNQYPYTVEKIVYTGKYNQILLRSIGATTIPPSSQKSREDFINQFTSDHINTFENVINISIGDATWERPGEGSGKKCLLFSCTLILENLYDDVEADITYCCSSYQGKQTSFEALGSANCSKYRLHKLEVPDPIYNGPMKLMVKVQQEIMFGLVKPSRSGELIINYAENMPHLGDGLKKEEFVLLSPGRSSSSESQ